ncbi:MAG: helicase-related protein [Sedimenticola sp.]
MGAIQQAEGPIATQTANAVLRALKEQQGDILAFLPGTGEIRQAEGLLRERLDADTVVCGLYGDLSKEAQDRAILPDEHGRRRVILATSIAETSLTIEGITTVVDSGWSRLPSFDPNSGLTRLQTQRVSLASADQRAGRAGRLGPGVCYRLWTPSEHSLLKPHTPPEILGADLAQLALELASWGVSDPADLNWLDPPPKGAYAQARELLLELEAIDEKGRLTETGGQMAGMALHPRLGHMLAYARGSGQLSRAADLAALISERDLFRRQPGGEALPVDIDERLHVLERCRASTRLPASVSTRPAGSGAIAKRAQGNSPHSPPEVCWAWPSRTVSPGAGQPGGRGTCWLPAGVPVCRKGIAWAVRSISSWPSWMRDVPRGGCSWRPGSRPGRSVIPTPGASCGSSGSCGTGPRRRSRPSRWSGSVPLCSPANPRRVSILISSWALCSMA